MKKFIGKYEDLKEIKSYSYDGKIRYICPYCDTVHKKAPDVSGSVIYNQKTQSGYCFRCETVITHDGLKDLSYIQSQLLKEQKKEEDRLVKIDWLQPISENEVALEYMNNRLIYNRTLERFNVKACHDPLDGVVFINKVIDQDYTDFMQARFIENPKFKHSFLKNLTKKLCWTHLAESNDIIICEGFTDGLSAYQHSQKFGEVLHPLILGSKNITGHQLTELKEFSSRFTSVNVWVCMDGGFFEDTLKVASKVYQTCYNSVVKVIPMPFDKDLNEITFQEYQDAIKKSLLFEPNKVRYIRNKIYGKSQ